MTLDLYDQHPEHSSMIRAARVRPYISVLFDCCRVYDRIYRRPHERVYRGRCPKCLRVLTVRVGPDGIPHRMFRAS